MVTKGGSGFKARSKGILLQSSRAHVVPSSSNHSSYVDIPRNTPLSTNSHSHRHHGLDSFPSVEGTPSPTTGMQRISHTTSPVDASSIPTHTPASSLSSSDNTLWVESGQKILLFRRM